MQLVTKIITVLARIIKNFVPNCVESTIVLKVSQAVVHIIVLENLELGAMNF
jgi:hypothetical protein